MTTKQLRAYAKLAKDMGIKSFKIDGLEMEIDLTHTNYRPITALDKLTETDTTPEEDTKPISEEDLLLWSVQS